VHRPDVQWRQGFILLSDILGVSMLVDAINNRKPSGASESAVLGPFHGERAPELPIGANIYLDPILDDLCDATHISINIKAALLLPAGFGRLTALLLPSCQSELKPRASLSHRAFSFRPELRMGVPATVRYADAAPTLLQINVPSPGARMLVASVPTGGFSMNTALRSKILELLDKHRILSLATLRPDGWPQATTVGYVSRGLTLWFMTGKDTQKARNLKRDNRVSLTIDHDTTDPTTIAGLSMAARAFPVTQEARIRDILFVELPKKYPEYTSMMSGLDISSVAVFELRPEVISVLDYSKGFAHTDEVTVADADRNAA